MYHFFSQDIVNPLLMESPEEVGDLYLDVAEAYMECGDYSEAKPYLINLVHSEKYHLVRLIVILLKVGFKLNLRQNCFIIFNHITY